MERSRTYMGFSSAFPMLLNSYVCFVRKPMTWRWNCSSWSSKYRMFWQTDVLRLKENLFILKHFVPASWCFKILDSKLINGFFSLSLQCYHCNYQCFRSNIPYKSVTVSSTWGYLPFYGPVKGFIEDLQGNMKSRFPRYRRKCFLNIKFSGRWAFYAYKLIFLLLLAYSELCSWCLWCTGDKKNVHTTKLGNRLITETFIAKFITSIKPISIIPSSRILTCNSLSKFKNGHITTIFLGIGN